MGCSKDDLTADTAASDTACFSLTHRVFHGSAPTAFPKKTHSHYGHRGVFVSLNDVQRVKNKSHAVSPHFFPDTVASPRFCDSAREEKSNEATGRDHDGSETFRPRAILGKRS
jgi:hypothetical protein